LLPLDFKGLFVEKNQHIKVKKTTFQPPQVFYFYLFFDGRYPENSEVIDVSKTMHLHKPHCRYVSEK